MPDLEPFIPDRIVNRLMGAGDIEGVKLEERTYQLVIWWENLLRRMEQEKFKKGQFKVLRIFLGADGARWKSLESYEVY